MKKVCFCAKHFFWVPWIVAQKQTFSVFPPLKETPGLSLNLSPTSAVLQTNELRNTMFNKKGRAMNKLMIYVAVLIFSTVTITEAYAQGRGRGHHRKAKKEYAKHYEKQRKHTYRYAKERDKADRKYYEKREKAYRKYAKHHHKRYRDHDDWYYDRRFHRRSDYVYFPKHRTYYDPYRRGYVYRRHNDWVFDRAMPSFMVGLDLGRVNVQFMGRLPL